MKISVETVIPLEWLVESTERRAAHCCSREQEPHQTALFCSQCGERLQWQRFIRIRTTWLPKLKDATSELFLDQMLEEMRFCERFDLAFDCDDYVRLSLKADKMSVEAVEAVAATLRELFRTDLTIIVRPTKS